MPHILLPDDGWADLADPKKVTERKRKPVLRAMAAHLGVQAAQPVSEDGTGALTEDSIEAMSALSEAVMVALVTAWSFPAPITLDGLQDLPGDAYDALRDACGSFTGALLPSFAADTDPKDPPPSGSSPESVTS